MPLFRWLSLRQLLTVPYGVLVLILTLALGSLSYQTGRNAVDTLSEKLLAETAARIAQAVELNVLGSGAVLETAFPSGMTAPESVAAALPALRTRFWQATSVHRSLNSYVYYGDDQGHFIGLLRQQGEAAELRLRTQSAGVRQLHSFNGIAGPLGPGRPEERLFEPRERPWYRAGQQTQAETWTAIYIDFRSRELVSTRARRVQDAQGQGRGVVATDISLRHLSEFVRSLPLSPNGIAYITEPDGNLIASSRGNFLKPNPTGQPERLNAADSADPLLRSSHLAVQALRAGGAAADGPQAALIDGPRGQPVQLAHVRIRDKAGLDWLIVVAVPRSDFLQNVTDNATRSLWLGLLAALAVVGIGLVSLEVLSRDLRKIGVAARQVGDGHFDLPLDVSRSDEIGDLARSFSAMKQRLATDPLTGLASREAILRRAEDRLQQQRRAADRAPFALLFIDVNGFKQINDRHGHGVGDQVLVELGRRLRSALRSSDSLGRLAGDEFLLLIDQIGSEDQLAPLLAALHQRLAEPLVCLQAAGVGAANEDAGISVAIGVALSPRDGQDLISLLHHADADMYRRKPGAQALEA